MQYAPTRHRTSLSAVAAVEPDRPPARSLLACLIAAALAGALLPAPANAQSNEQLQRENAQLRAEIARLRGVAAEPVEAAAAPAPAPAPVPPATAAVAAAGDAALLDAVIVKSAQIKQQPASISAVTGEELEKFHVNNFRDIVNRLGNVRTSWQNPNTASIFVRGVGWAAGAGVLEPSVGVSVDGVGHGINAISALSNYLDIESVQVVRGPSGTDGGRAANVGRVEITTRKPGFSPEARAAITLGERNTTIATAVVGGALVDETLAYRLSVNRETADGPFDNANDTHYSWRNTDRTNVRAQLLFTPNDRLEANLSVDVTPKGREICENCFWFNTRTPARYDWTNPATGQPGQVNYAEDVFGKLQRRWFAQNPDYTIDDYYRPRVNTLGEYPNTYKTAGVTANLAYRLSEAGTLTSITGWRDYDFSQGAGSHTGFEWLRAPRGTQTRFEQLSQELRLDTQLSDRLHLRTGGFYFHGRFPNYSQTERYGTDAGAYYANAAQYALLDPVDPALPEAVDAAGRLLLFNSTYGLVTQRRERYDNRSLAAYSDLRWEVTHDFNLNAGLRISRETRNSRAGSAILADGFAGELNPARVNNVAYNGFANDAAGNLAAGNSAAQLALADLVAQKYFGVAHYAGLDATQRQQVAAAKAIRAGRIGASYLDVAAPEYRETLFSGALGADYRINDALTVYGSYRYGEKPGIAQIVGATAQGGKSLPASAESTRAWELGVKSLLLDGTLSLAGTVFLQDIDDYLQNTFVHDELQTALNNDGKPAYVAALGNVPKVRTRGLELDVAYVGIPYTTLRFSGAYTDATYRRFPRAPNPAELGGANPGGPYYDASGKTLPGAPKVSGNLFADVSYPLGQVWALQANLNYNYQSSYYTDTLLSRYAKTDPLGTTDVSIGLGRQDGRFAISLVARNLFDQDTGVPLTWNSYKPGIPRWLGVTVQASLY
ncbi:TonB-dependent receptor [Stenotrophomonas mori]|uniref:TonB-dependent receptor n=1 Tax=Stenotrophomonas mori TaxID=2871096 RepID=A0ABT0SKI5_9GAMM|nr:TonB-dependent receptor [Stenotrophomonas mori]MCL7715845.1 TonB-dependent receptor [Stenotrophomonas mori]